MRARRRCGGFNALTLGCGQLPAGHLAPPSPPSVFPPADADAAACKQDKCTGLEITQSTGVRRASKQDLAHETTLPPQFTRPQIYPEWLTLAHRRVNYEALPTPHLPPQKVKESSFHTSSNSYTVTSPQTVTCRHRL